MVAMYWSASARLIRPPSPRERTSTSRIAAGHPPKPTESRAAWASPIATPVRAARAATPAGPSRSSRGEITVTSMDSDPVVSSTRLVRVATTRKRWSFCRTSSTSSSSMSGASPWRPAWWKSSTTTVSGRVRAASSRTTSAVVTARRVDGAGGVQAVREPLPEDGGVVARPGQAEVDDLLLGGQGVEPGPDERGLAEPARPAHDGQGAVGAEEPEQLGLHDDVPGRARTLDHHRRCRVDQLLTPPAVPRHPRRRPVRRRAPLPRLGDDRHLSARNGTPMFVGGPCRLRRGR